MRNASAKKANPCPEPSHYERVSASAVGYGKPPHDTSRGLVFIELEELAAAIESLQKDADMLRGRLAPVIGPDCPPVETLLGTAVPKPSPCEVAGRVAEMADAVRSTTAELKEISRRVQV